MNIELTPQQMEEITIENLLWDYSEAVYEHKYELCDSLLDVLEHYGISEIEANSRCGTQ